MTVPAPAVGDDATALWADEVAAAANAQYGGDQFSNAAVTLTAAATSYACSGSAVTFTLTAPTRVRLYVICSYTMASGTNGAYYVRAAYNSGSSVSLGSALYVTSTMAARTVIPASGMAASASIEGTVLLPAGTYTAYPVVARVAGGSATDTAAPHYTAVYAVGAT